MNWGDKIYPLKDIQDAAEKIRNEAKARELSPLEKVYDASAAYYWSLLAFDDPMYHEAYLERFHRIKREYEEGK